MQRQSDLADEDPDKEINMAGRQVQMMVKNDAPKKKAKAMAPK